MEWSIPHIRAICDPTQYKQQRWSSDQEAEMLHALTLRAGILKVVEIGTGYAFLSVCFAHAGATVQTFDLVDRPKVYDHPKWPYPELNAKITAKAIPSPECFRGLLVSPEPTLFFIDGDHSEEAVTEDIRLVNELLKAGDVMAVHDATGERGPRRAWQQFQIDYPGRNFETWETKNGVGIYRP